jgi:hypothetical protein
MSLAYLDPGSGSLIVSAVVGGTAAAGVAVKAARAKFTGAFSRKRKAGPEAEATEESAASAEEVEAAAEESTAREPEPAKSDS